MISRKGVNREVRSEACPADRIGRGRVNEKKFLEETKDIKMSLLKRRAKR